jgi:hypothetical protein
MRLTASRVPGRHAISFVMGILDKLLASGSIVSIDVPLVIVDIPVRQAALVYILKRVGGDHRDSRCPGKCRTKIGAQLAGRLVHLTGHDPDSADRLLLPKALERLEIMYSDPGGDVKIAGRAMTIDYYIVQVVVGRVIDRSIQLTSVLIGNVLGTVYVAHILYL